MRTRIPIILSVVLGGGLRVLARAPEAVRLRLEVPGVIPTRLYRVRIRRNFDAGPASLVYYGLAWATFNAISD